MLNTKLHGPVLLAPLANTLTTFATKVALMCALAIPTIGLGQEHHHYKLIVLGTLGGPQSYGDPGQGAANITNQGTAVGVADTAIPDPFYPNFSSYPFVFHVFTTKGGALVDLGGLFPSGDSTASFITENGLVSGNAVNGIIDPIAGFPAQSPVLWKDGHIINLGNLGGYEGGAGRVNSRGQVTGFTTNAIPDPFSIFYFQFFGGSSGGFTSGTQTRVFLWDEKSGMQDLGTLGGPDAFAPFINERGQIAGMSYTNFTANVTTGFPTQDPFLWENGRMIDLGTLGGTNGGAGDLNNRGQVVGQSNLAGDVFFHPFLWTAPGPMRDLGTLGGPTALATAINESGEVIGLADTAKFAGSTDAFLWRKGVMTDLGTLEGDCFSGAFGINARGQVTGNSITCDFTGFRAFLWENGTMIDLNVFVPPGVNLKLGDVESINDRGEMFGAGTLPSGEGRAFLLIPCDRNHPNIEGCDYSPMELSPVAASHTTPQRQMTPEDISRIHALLMNRHRGFMPRTIH
jgi:probable HAF family extracellular repeat protein